MASPSHIAAQPADPATAAWRRRGPGDALASRCLGHAGGGAAGCPRAYWDREPQPGGVTLRLPNIAETGNSVPLTVTVESPMTPDDHVLRLHVFVEGNPEPVAATYHLGVRAGKAEISTRMRLARSQTVLALAEMSDGSVRSGTASIVVTLGACVEESGE